MKFVTDLSKGILGVSDDEILWADILNCIPDTLLLDPNKLILNICCGHGTEADVIVKKMSALGVTDDEIRRRLYLVDKFNVFTNRAKRKGYKNVVTADILEWSPDIKFDVVIGNPPYQDADDSGGALWATIAKKAFDELVNDNGYVAMIHPPTFIGKHLAVGRGKSDYTCFAKNQITELHLFDAVEKNKYFPGVGTRVCWYVAIKQSPTTLTNIVGYDQGVTFKFETDFSKLTTLPTTINKLSASIHKKLIASGGLVFKQSRKLHYHTMKLRNLVSDNLTKAHPYKSYFSHKIVRYASFQFVDYKATKLMVPQTSTIDKSFVEANCNVSEDLFYIICKNQTEAKDLQQYLKSNLVTYIGKLYRPGRNLGALLGAGVIPKPTANIKWTQEELNYINSIVNPKSTVDS
jgi:hypothetical protein